LLGPNLVAVFGSPVLHEDDALRASGRPRVWTVSYPP